MREYHLSKFIRHALAFKTKVIVLIKQSAYRYSQTRFQFFVANSCRSLQNVWCDQTEVILTNNSPPSSSEESSNDNQRIGREVLLACGLLFGCTFLLLGIELAFPSVSGTSQAMLAVALLLIPGFVLRSKQTTVDDLGVYMGPVGVTLKNSMIAICVVFPVFIIGFHIFQTSILGAESQWDLSELNRWDQEIENAPTDPCRASESGPIAWTDRHGLWILGPPKTILAISGENVPSSARRVSCTDQGKAQAGTSVHKEQTTIRAGSNLRGLLVSLEGKDSIDLKISLNGSDIESNGLRIGRFQENVDGLTASKTPWWIFTYFIIHLGLIALPEEWFFRGYLQGRLDQRWGTPKRFLGVQIGWGLIVSALAFAALHPILIPGAHRLLVFFPALFFGWLRARTGNIGAAVIVHALSNLLLAIISRMYGVI